MAGIDRGSDELVVPEVERVGQVAEPFRVAVHQLARGDALLLGGEDVGQRVLVGAGEDVGIVAAEPVKTAEAVGLDELLDDAHVRPAVDVGDGGGDVVPVSSGHETSP